MPRFGAQVSSNGKVVKFDAPALWEVAKVRLKGKRVFVSIEKEHARRSDPQNRRFFGVIIPVCREILNQELRKAGSPLELSAGEVHEYLDRNILGEDETPIGPVRKHCSTLGVAEFCQYMDRVEAYFKTTFGAVFPDEETVREAGL